MIKQLKDLTDREMGVAAAQRLVDAVTRPCQTCGERRQRPNEVIGELAIDYRRSGFWIVLASDEYKAGYDEELARLRKDLA